MRRIAGWSRLNDWSEFCATYSAMCSYAQAVSPTSALSPSVYQLPTQPSRRSYSAPRRTGINLCRDPSVCRSHLGQLSAQRLGLLGAQQHSQATRAVRTATAPAPFMDDWACQWEMTKLDAPPNPQFHTRQPITKPFVDDPYSSVKVSVRGLLGKWVTYNENWFCFLPNLTF